MSVTIRIVLEVPDEDADPDDSTGLTSEAYDRFMASLEYDIVSGPERVGTDEGSEG